LRLSVAAIVEDIKLPDYKGRHVFTAKLRLLIFIVFWIIGILYFKVLWRDAPWVPLVISLMFLLTGVCYQNILKNRGLFIFFVLELASDLISMTLVVYLTGGPKSDYFTLYLMYCVAAGIFYNYQVATVASILSCFFYGLLMLALRLEWIHPFTSTVELPSWMNHPIVSTYGRFILLFMFLPITVYAVKISNFFSRLKERALEERNKQLVALNRISSTIRRMMSPKKVIQQVLAGVVEGLGYDVCLLVLSDKEEKRLRFHLPQENFLIEQVEARTGFKLDEMTITEGVFNSIVTAIKRNRVVFRFELSELVKGAEPHWDTELADRVQRELGFKKFVIMPLVAERRVIGALIGISRTEFVDESRVDVLENFSNQAALAIESAQLFEEIQTKNIELERANKIKSEFLAIMSHELRTPLTAIIGFSELMLEEVLGPLKPEQRDTLQEVVNNGGHLLHLINSILDLAKVEAGKMELVSEPFSLEDLVHEVGSSISSLVKKKNQNFNIEMVPHLPAIQADSRKLRQILLNLLSNAIKFTPEAGKIILRVKFHPSIPSEGFCPKVRQLAISPKGYFEIVVQDTGIGIDPKDIEDIFDVFEQVDSSFTRKYQGTGLGLALTKQFVEMHGGVIWVESQPNQGAKFFLLIPAEAQEVFPRHEGKKVESFVMGAQQLLGKTGSGEGN
jgi:signal transduction histidine kinase